MLVVLILILFLVDVLMGSFFFEMVEIEFRVLVVVVWLIWVEVLLVVLLELRLERVVVVLWFLVEVVGLEVVVLMLFVVFLWIVGGWGLVIFGGIGRWWVRDGYIMGEFGGDGVDGVDVG